MRRIATLVVLLAAWLMYVPPGAYAHQCGHHGSSGCAGCTAGCSWGCGHHGMPAQRGSSPDRPRAGGVPAAEQSREGQVVEVVYLPGATKDTAMVEIRLMVGTEQILARLGPTGFLRQQQMDVREGDTVSVAGYWVTAGDGDVLIATRVAKQGKTVQLRDSWGRSAW